MSPPMTTIEIDSHSAMILQSLREKARAEGIPLHVLLERLNNTVSDSTNQTPAAPRNEAMLAALQRSAERLKDLPVTGSTAETLKMLRDARSGKMWGPESDE